MAENSPALAEVPCRFNIYEPSSFSALLLTTCDEAGCLHVYRLHWIQRPLLCMSPLTRLLYSPFTVIGAAQDGPDYLVHIA